MEFHNISLNAAKMLFQNFKIDENGLDSIPTEQMKWSNRNLIFNKILFEVHSILHEPVEFYKELVSLKPILFESEKHFLQSIKN